MNNPNDEENYLENLKIEEQKKPIKSESMGLLDAEGYKFLDGSDSNSEERDRAIRSESKEVDSSVKKQSKPSSWLNQHDGQGV